MNETPHSSAPDDSYESLSPVERREADRLEALLGDLRDAGDPPGADFLAAEIRRIQAATSPGGPALRSADAAGSGSERLREERVIQRVLARTTQEDLGRRGDMGVLLRFAGERLQESPLLRVAAALLIVQLTLVPLVAWQMLKAPRPGSFQTGFEPSTEELAEALRDLPAEEVAELDLEDGEWESLSAPEAAAIELEFGLGKLALEEAMPDTMARMEELEALLADQAAVSPLGLALDAMTRRGARQTLSEPTTLLEAVVLAEARLFRFQDSGEWEGLPMALDRVALAMELSPELRPLGARVLMRAHSLGVKLPELRASGAAGEWLKSWQRGSDAWLRAIGEAALAVSSDASLEEPYVRAWAEAVGAGR
ncbi:MAG: hypothetical protein AAGG01_09045 [Planctomycetota bacterium]